MGFKALIAVFLCAVVSMIPVSFATSLVPEIKSKGNNPFSPKITGECEAVAVTNVCTCPTDAEELAKSWKQSAQDINRLMQQAQNNINRARAYANSGNSDECLNSFDAAIENMKNVLKLNSNLRNSINDKCWVDPFLKDMLNADLDDTTNSVQQLLSQSGEIQRICNGQIDTSIARAQTGTIIGLSALLVVATGGYCLAMLGSTGGAATEGAFVSGRIAGLGMRVLARVSTLSPQKIQIIVKLLARHITSCELRNLIAQGLISEAELTQALLLLQEWGVISAATTTAILNTFQISPI